MKRRRFMKVLGIGLCLPHLSRADAKGFGGSSCNLKSKRKILVVYASEYGSTAEVAKAIGKLLCSDDMGVEVTCIKKVKDVRSYEQVIIGSPIQYDTWMDEAKSFLQMHEEELSKKSVSYFFTSLTLSSKSDKAKKQAQRYANDLYLLNTMVKPQSIGQFAGVLDYSKFSFSFRLLAKGMFAFLGVKEGDYRDWSAIEEWSKNINIKG